MGAGSTEMQMRSARFAGLSNRELYGLCRLRIDVFVVEQQCPYPELDGRDLEPETVHLWFEADGEPVSTVRVLRGDDDGGRVIGRVATAAAYRNRGLAGRLLDTAIELCAGAPVSIGAQAYLESWYERFGFRRSGPGYLEDGIPHIPMHRPAS